MFNVYEKYDLTSIIGVKRVFDDYHDLIELKYMNLEVCEFLIDFVNLVRISKLTKLEKLIITNVFYKCLCVKEAATELEIEEKQVREIIKKSLSKISDTYKILEGKEEELKTYTFVDLETTGLDFEKDQVIEIGALKTDETGKEIGRFTTFVALNEGSDLSPQIELLTGISKNDLKTGMLEQLALQALDCFIGDSVVVAHNAVFDLSFLSRNKRYVPVQSFICTKTMSYFLDPNLSTKLKSVSERYNIRNKNPHRAFSDVVTTKKIFFKMKNKLKNKGKDEKEYMNIVVDFYGNDVQIENAKVIRPARQKVY